MPVVRLWSFIMFYLRHIITPIFFNLCVACWLLFLELKQHETRVFRLYHDERTPPSPAIDEYWSLRCKFWSQFLHLFAEKACIDRLIWCEDLLVGYSLATNHKFLKTFLCLDLWSTMCNIDKYSFHVSHYWIEPTLNIRYNSV